MARVPIDRFRVPEGRPFRLASVDPADTGGIEGKKEAEELLEAGVKRLAELQERLYAEDSEALLLVFQGMDSAGKDGAIKHLFSGVSPTGCEVSPFKAPSAEDIDHDFLWRAVRRLPERGRIGIFNRSYYEEVVTVRVRPEFLEAQRLPPRKGKGSIWDERFADIVNFERYLTRNGVVVRKFFLHISKAEQKRRLLARIDDPENRWKVRERDVAERARWKEYQRHWSEAIARTSTAEAPWFVVPADKKWFSRLLVAEAVVATLEKLHPQYPRLDRARRAEVRRAKKALQNE